ncbi:hypothetical protein GCM10008967_19290 [Bacillus carboniphilus]|uniref:SCP domain-containing protein n=1 Tax=Bacillus carboniphilus TaxID=86663 RepID=A0ABP3FY63_9BACI
MKTLLLFVVSLLSMGTILTGCANNDAGQGGNNDQPQNVTYQPGNQNNMQGTPNINREDVREMIPDNLRPYVNEGDIQVRRYEYRYGQVPQGGNAPGGQAPQGTPGAQAPGGTAPGGQEQGTPGGQEGENVPNNEPTDGTVKNIERQVVELTNQERQRNGLSPLKLNEKLSDVARLKSQDMRDKNYFAHNSPTYGSPFEMMQQFHVQYQTAGENIAAGQRSAQEVVQQWMDSPGHRKNILNPEFTEIGVGHVEGGNMGVYWTQMFIKPR